MKTKITKKEVGRGARAKAGPKFPVPEPSARAIRDFMRNTAPPSAQDEEISPTSTIMCHIMVLNSVIERMGNRILESHGLTLPQWFALGCVANAGEKGIPHSHLGHRLMLSKAPITGLVDRLERAGLVRRVPDVQDRRISRAVITPDGEKMWWTVKNHLREHSAAMCGDCFSSAEQNQFLSLMGRLLDAFASKDPTLSDFSTREVANATVSEIVSEVAA